LNCHPTAAYANTGDYDHLLWAAYLDLKAVTNSAVCELHILTSRQSLTVQSELFSRGQFAVDSDVRQLHWILFSIHGPSA